MSLLLTLLWLLAAAGVAAFSRAAQGAAVWALVVVGIPILGLATWEHGPVMGTILLALGATLLCLPHLPVSRRVHRWLRGQAQ